MAEADSIAGIEVPSLLRSKSEHAMTRFSAQFEAQIGYAKKLPNVVESVQKRIKAPHWTSTAEKYIVRETHKKFFYVFDNQIFYCQTLGLGPWIANLDDHLEVMSIVFNKMEVTRIKRLELQISAQLPLGMSHSEMCDLVFGSYIVDREELTSTYGKLDDVLLVLHGYHKGIRSQTTIAPQTTEQSKKTFWSIGNLDAFVEPRLIDTCVKEHFDLISQDCLYLSMEMIKEDAPVSNVRSLLHDSLEGAEKIAEETVLRLKGLKRKGQKTHVGSALHAE
jgi:hypothetical protein